MIIVIAADREIGMMIGMKKKSSKLGSLCTLSR